VSILLCSELLIWRLSGSLRTCLAHTDKLVHQRALRTNRSLWAMVPPPGSPLRNHPQTCPKGGSHTRHAMPDRPEADTRAAGNSPASPSARVDHSPRSAPTSSRPILASLRLWTTPRNSHGTVQNADQSRARNKPRRCSSSHSSGCTAGRTALPPAQRRRQAQSRRA